MTDRGNLSIQGCGEFLRILLLLHCQRQHLSLLRVAVFELTLSSVDEVSSGVCGGIMVASEALDLSDGAETDRLRI